MSNVWSVRGVPPALRREIVKAAQEAGLPVAEWLDQALAGSLRQPPPPEVDALLSKVDNCLAAIENLDRAAQRPSGSR